MGKFNVANLAWDNRIFQPDGTTGRQATFPAHEMMRTFEVANGLDRQAERFY